MMVQFSLALLVSLSGQRCVGAFQAQHTRHAVSPPKQVRLFSTIATVDETAQRDIETMEQWAESCGVQRSPSFQLSGKDIDGRLDIFGVAAEDMEPNSPVLFVPSQMILSTNRAIQEVGRLEEAEILITSLNAQSELRQFYLMLKVLIEWERGEESPWFPYFNSLPRYYSNAASMTNFCYKCLPPLVAKLAMEERVKMNHLIVGVKKTPFLSQETKGNQELLRLAFQIVYTRSFDANDGSGDLCLAPMADMLNHGAVTNVDVSYDEDGNCFVQTHGEVIPAGTPLSFTYADPTNPSFLFARYGFLDETSQATFCKIIPPHIDAGMESLGYAQNRMLFYKETGEVSPEVWDILLYQILGSSNVAKKRELMKAHEDGDYETKQALHQQFYPETSAKLLDHITTFLEDLDKLSSKTDGNDPREHPRLPLILRHNEFVRETFLRVRGRYFGL